MAHPAPAPLDQQSKLITINPDGTFTPTTGVVINPGGEVKFDVNYPAGMNTCTITFGSITFSYEAGVEGGPTNTIKVG
jgi:hypothetical protein